MQRTTEQEAHFEIVVDNIRSRKTAHKWKAVEVETRIIERALEAAHHAPCHKHTWPWRFSVVGKETRKQLVNIGVNLQGAKVEGGALSDDKRKMVEAKLGNAGGLIIVRQVRSDDEFRSKEDYAAVSCALQNMMLTVHAAGYCSKWATGDLTRHQEVYKLAHIDVDAEEIVGFFWIGVPAEVPTIKRPPVQTVVDHLP